MENEFGTLTLVELFESKTNPRRHFDKARQAELTESVKTQGVLVPLLVRASAQGGVPGYEVIAGARRFRAAKAAGLETVPVRRVEMSDDQVLEVQLIENCGSCPKRTGNQAELFGDVKSADVCTDPKCFHKKAELHAARRVEEARAQGSKVIEPKETKKLIPYGVSGSYTYVADSSLVTLEQRCPDDPKNRSYRQLLGKSIEPAALTVAITDGGEAVELIHKKTAAKLLKEAGHTFGTTSTPKVDPKAQLRSKAAVSARLDAIARVVRAAEKSAPLQVLRVAARFQIDMCDWQALALRRGIKEAYDAVEQFIEKADQKALQGLILEMILGDSPTGFSGTFEKGIFKLFRVDLKLLEAEALKRIKAEDAPAPSKKTASKAKKSGKGPLARKRKAA